jgi:leucyl/phenylalanyl-tRNA--protein transferase
MYYLSKELYFSNVAHAHSSGIIALGGDLSSERLQLAYQSGIFPLRWNPTVVTKLVWCYFRGVGRYKSMRNILNRDTFTVTFNQN